MHFTSKELELRERIITALHSSLSLPLVLEATRAPLLELTPADHMGLCVMTPGPPLDFQWLVPGHRLTLLDEYPRWADSDFVRAPIFAQPNVVLRDTQMLPRRALEASALYRRSQELDLRLEHVMAVLLPAKETLLGAFTLYRDRRVEFSEHEAALLTSLTPHLTNAIRNCRDMQAARSGARLLEELYNRPDAGFLVVLPPSRELLRSERARVLLDTWFAPSDLHASGIPGMLLERLQALTRMSPDERLKHNPLVSLRGETYLVVRFIELPQPEGPAQWALSMNEVPMSIPLPQNMRLQLTNRQVDIAQGILRNWSNEQIAEHLGLSEDTVKTHVRDIFGRLKVDNRADFLYQASHLNRPL
ncbi:LuxR C-terminal-related transcriptional regulator [Myxococcus faecalis]|jgi:DNA-binding CsgD family transcriptional regulator|uniref:LuxR C-terminal-related transcriptional regulator n=1 Tax=Myxococcus TaxID=32 RepID=UPI001CBF8231|nr:MULTISPECIES: LuxR C-terminal-related transcriptional regulator [unclassified Myxococcus]MBZ4401447.1 LuxR C-terminal-related transcriptional regulator [Myxococcus sp. AS-1-15]MBZ4414597.1 LuxR C-terminal-related transcriptional regulator [Myxococcus sp. XM-1-1-1]BDT32418.1 LuxR C-terminal-related transcriptional regulator [Myxococcus sp. MH1]